MLTILALTLLAAPADDALDYLEQAEDTLEHGDLLGARHALQLALKIDKDNLDALYALGLVAIRLDDYAAATKVLQEVLRLDPYNDDSRLALARSLWAAGATQPATVVLDGLLERHPAWPDGLALKDSLARGESPSLQRWRPIIRLGVGTEYDTNVGLSDSTLPEVSRLAAPSANAELTVGAGNVAGVRPLTLLANFSTETALQKRTAVEPFMPTIVGATGILRHAFGGLVTALDLRYQELFTETFATHRERLVAPSVWGAWHVHPRHELRLLVGADYRQPFGAKNAEDNTMLRASLRDHVKLGGSEIIIDLLGRHNFDTSEQDPFGSVTGFSDAAAGLYVDQDLTADFGFFVSGTLQGRKFVEGLRETYYDAQAGLRLFVGNVELHGEYTYSANLSNSLRSYTRHEAGVGVRFWYM